MTSRFCSQCQAEKSCASLAAKTNLIPENHSLSFFESSRSYYFLFVYQSAGNKRNNLTCCWTFLEGAGRKEGVREDRVVFASSPSQFLIWTGALVVWQCLKLPPWLIWHSVTFHPRKCTNLVTFWGEMALGAVRPKFWLLKIAQNEGKWLKEHLTTVMFYWFLSSSLLSDTSQKHNSFGQICSLLHDGIERLPEVVVSCRPPPHSVWILVVFSWQEVEIQGDAFTRWHRYGVQRLSGLMRTISAVMIKSARPRPPQPRLWCFLDMTSLF